MVELPSAEYPYGWLRAKRIIVRMTGIPAAEEKKILPNLRFNFSYQETGDWMVEIIHVDRGARKVLVNFNLKPQQLEFMKQAGKTAKLSFSNDFITLNCFNLLQLLARIASSGGE